MGDDHPFNTLGYEWCARLRGMLIFFVFVMGKSTDGLLTLLQQQGVFSPLEGLECVR